MNIHPTAIVANGAKLAADVEVGPYSIIGAECEIGPGCVLGARVILEHRVVLGEGTKLGHGTILGGNPQALDFDQSRGDTGVRIGKNNIIREYVTINRATAVNGDTLVGDGNFLMTGCHLGHDCRIGNRVIVANDVLLAGHVGVADGAFLGGGSVFHQFVMVGSLAMVQGDSALSKNLPPYLVASRLNQVAGLNSIGLRRAGLSPEARMQLKRAFRLLYLSDLNVSQALEEAAKESWGPEATLFFDFVRESKKRGICDYVGKGSAADE
ncbi:MAG: acyl-ACP--UDP-N-acetylglucosamine O-acyltransferase [Chthoniobacterales bacterium]